MVNGTLDKPGDKDKGYTVEIAIPWAAFAKAKNAPPEARRHVAHELLRHEEQRRRGVVAHLRARATSTRRRASAASRGPPPICPVRRPRARQLPRH